jgi:hypothetical protein
MFSMSIKNNRKLKALCMNGFRERSHLTSYKAVLIHNIDISISISINMIKNYR